MGIGIIPNIGFLGGIGIVLGIGLIVVVAIFLFALMREVKDGIDDEVAQPTQEDPQDLV